MGYFPFSIQLAEPAFEVSGREGLADLNSSNSCMTRESGSASAARVFRPEEYCRAMNRRRSQTGKVPALQGAGYNPRPPRLHNWQISPALESLLRCELTLPFGCNVLGSKTYLSILLRLWATK